MIRPPKLEDAKGLLENFSAMTRETDFLLFTKEEAMELTITSEEDYIRGFITNAHEQLLLIAEVNGAIIGSLTLTAGGFRKRGHTAEMGIAVAHRYGNMGIGRRLLTAMVRWAEEHERLEIIHLSVFSSNEKAMHLYRNFGFKEYGRFPDAIQQPDGTYADLVLMHLVLGHHHH